MASPEIPPAEGMFRELLWVHSMIRRDLATVRRLATEVSAGAAAAEVRATLRTLQTQGPLWKLKVNCLSYCRFVHLHHSLEDIHLFPILRRTQPALGSIVDRLEADHLQIATFLNRIEDVADRLDGPESPANRDHLATVLGELADHLLTHLAFEEETIGPTLSRWHTLPAE